MAGEEKREPEVAKSQAPELRLLDRRAFVAFPPLEVAPGVRVTDFGLQIPDVSFPFSVSGGALRYQKKTLHFGFLEVSLDAERLRRAVQEVAAGALELEDVQLTFRTGYLEGQARLRGPAAAPATFKVAFDAEGERLGVYLYDVRLYAFTPTPAAVVPLLLSRAAQSARLLPDVEVRGTSGFSARVLPALVQAAAVTRGFRVPSLEGARLTGLDVSATALRLRFASTGLPPPALLDEELLLALEGARAFAEAEALLAAGRLKDARDAYLRGAEPQDAHPFALERLLGLLVADPGAHELALDVAQSVARRRPHSAAPLWVEALVRERRGEPARAAERWLTLSALCRKRGEDAGAVAAAQAAARVAEGVAPQMAIRALHELLGLRPDHLPSLQALARAADASEDRAGAMRAYRRISALARDPAESGEAHVQLARLSVLAEDDVAGARLHCEAALRLSPDHPGALELLGELCHRAGEHLRALKALDRLRDVALARHDLAQVGRANLLAGRVWEVGLHNLDNALLRYREAVALLPGEPEALVAAAHAAEGLGRTAEAVTGYQQGIELAGPAPASAAVRAAVHRAHRALAVLERTRLQDVGAARAHLEAALALRPEDTEVLEELIPLYRSANDVGRLALALEQAAPLLEEGTRRAVYLAEAGELQRTRLDNSEMAEALLARALDADGTNRVALEGMLALAEQRREGPLLCRCLQALAAQAVDAAERARLLRRLAVAAKDLSSDVTLAAEALAEVLRLEPDDLVALGELCALQRKRADMPGLAAALEQRARVAEAQGDVRLAVAALRELAQVRESRLGRLGEALVALEKAARLQPGPAVLLELAELSMRAERPEHARRALEDVLSALPPTAPKETRAEVQAKLGRACELLGDDAAAMALYAEALPLRPADDALAERLQALYQKASRSRELAELWAARAQQLLASGRSEAAVPLLLKSAKGLLSAGQRDSAHQKLYAAFELQPQGPLAAEVLEALAELELQAGNRPEAAQLLARQAERAGEAKLAGRLFLRAAEVTPDAGRMLAWLDAALRQDGTLLQARLRRGRARLPNDARGALEDLEAALQLLRTDPLGLPPSERVQLLRAAAAAARAAGEPELARRHLAAYADAQPVDVEAQLELAALYREAGALQALQSLLSGLWPRLSGPQAREAARELVALSKEVHRPEEAQAVLRSLLEKDATDVWAAEALLGLLGQEAGAKEEALALRSALAASTNGSERAAHLVARAHLARGLGRVAEARADLLRAAPDALAPGPVWQEVAELAAALDDAPGELAAWQAALSAAPNLSAVAAPRLLALGRSLVQAGEARAAGSAFALAAASAPDAASLSAAHLGAAEAAFAQGDAQGAAASLLQAAAQGPAEARVQALLRRAELAEAAQDTATAADSLERVLTLEPHNPSAGSRLRMLLERSGDWAGVAELLVSRLPHVSRAEAARLSAELGGIYLKLDSPGPAEAALRRAAQLDPAAAGVRSQLVGLLVQRGAWQEAAETARQAAPLLAPSEAAALLRDAARAAGAAGADAEALALRRRAQQLHGAAGEELRALAFALYRAGARAEALPLFSTAAQSATFEDTPDRDEELLLAYADLQGAGGDMRGAEETLRRLLSERPLSTAALERLAEALRARSPRESIVLLASALEGRAPSRSVGTRLLELGQRALTELADPELAATLLERAAAAMPEPSAARRAQAELFRQTGRSVELLRTLRTLWEEASRAGEVDSVLGALDELAQVAAELGRTDEALEALESLRDGLEQRGATEEAARAEARRAELLLSARRDTLGAEAALARSFALHPSVPTALRAAALAAAREDVSAQAVWLERALPFHSRSAEKADALVALSELHAESLADESRAEAFLRGALAEAPGHAVAEGRLLLLLERAGRTAEVAAYFESAARALPDSEARVERLRRAAEVYTGRLGNKAAAIEALGRAHALRPSDAQLTGELADLLAAAGRPADAAPYDAQLLRDNPFRAPSAERHLAWLALAPDARALATLHLARAERQGGTEAASSYLEAARAYRQAGLEAEALAAEDRAFAHAPDSDAAFRARRGRVGKDARALSELLVQRAQAVPSEAPALLSEAGGLLAAAGEPLQAAEAWDALLRLRPEDVPALLARGELAAEAGGPLAAQPYDRRLLATGADTLSTAQRLRLQLRLGHAALSSGALKDAAQALEAVVAEEPDAESGRAALSLLAEVYAKAQDAAGSFRTSLLLARRARPDEAEALYRRAAALLDGPEALEALLPLAELRPTEGEVVDRALSALESIGRTEEHLALLLRAARASGGTRAAELLLRAAALATRQGDAEGALLHLRAAVVAEPSHTESLEALTVAERARGETEALGRTLGALVERVPLVARSAHLRVVAARAVRGADAAERIRALLQPVVDAGPSEAYAEALERLEPVLSAAPVARAKALAARAELQTGSARAALLLEAAELAESAGDVARAAFYARASVAAEPSLPSLLLHARLAQATGALAEAAAALEQAAQRSTGPEAVPRWLQAAEAHRAAGQLPRARALLEQLAQTHPEVLVPSEWAQRLLSVGAAEAAALYGYGPLLAQGAFAEALEVAEALGDGARLREALWGVAGSAPEPAVVQRLAGLVLEAGSQQERLRAARLCEAVRARELASALYRAVVLAPVSEEDARHQEGGPRVEALAHLVALGEGDAVLGEALEHLDESAPAALVEALASYARGRRGAERERALRSLASRVPGRSAPLWQELFQRARDDNRLEEAAQALSGWVEATAEAPQRAALRTQLGDLFLHLGQTAEARAAYEKAASGDAPQSAAVQKLLALTSEAEAPERFVLLAERLLALNGEDALLEVRPRLAAAYARLGRLEEAASALQALPGTAALLEQRAQLADALGRPDEAFALREQLVQSPAERAELGVHALQAGLLERAAKLLSGVEAQVPASAQREVAERLAGTEGGARVAANLWPALLSQGLLDVAGFTAYAEALRRTGRALEAARFEDFARAASGDLPAAQPPATVGRLSRPRTVPTHPLPPGAVAVEPSSMPQLHTALRLALSSLGAPEVLVYLDPAGGPEAWLAGPETLVLGAGALSHFGPAELTFLVALALLLGDEGVQLAWPGPVSAVTRVAPAAFLAVPVPLAAARVLLLLEAGVRGADAAGVDAVAVLAASEAFRAVVQRALALV
ncbi:MAG: flagellar hook-length control protein FliK [Myxococcaceae bacterium]